jgi:hypothetical protein
MASTRLRSTSKRAGAVALAVAAGSTGLIAATAGSASAVNWDSVAQCESGGNWSTNTGNGFQGGLQFTQSTWSANGGGSGSPASASREKQIQVANNVLRTQGIGAWPVCGGRGGSASSSTPTFGNNRASRSTTRTAVVPKTTRSTHTSSSSQVGTINLSKRLVNQKRADVALAQKRLDAHGANLVQDGRFGDKTDAATRAFQASHGLTVDGVIGKNTQRALRS